MNDVKTCSPDHKHNEASTCYVLHRCRCEPCKRDHAAREMRRTKLKAYGRWDPPYVDAGPAREHVNALRARGLGPKSIAKLAGVSTTSVRTLIYGREDYQNGIHGPRHGEVLKRIARAKSEKILAVAPSLEQLHRNAHVPARATVRRVQALIAIGWSMSAIAAAAGVDFGSLARTMNRYARARRRDDILVRPTTAIAIASCYDRLSLTAPPQETRAQKITASRMRNLGAARKWPVPMDWEAVDNDFDRVHAVRRSAAESPAQEESA